MNLKLTNREKKAIKLINIAETKSMSVLKRDINDYQQIENKYKSEIKSLITKGFLIGSLEKNYNLSDQANDLVIRNPKLTFLLLGENEKWFYTTIISILAFIISIIALFRTI